MLTHSAVIRNDDMTALLDEVTRELVTTGLDNSDGLIALPQLYPGGSVVVVRVRRDDDSFIVTDQGHGYMAAEHLGGISTFTRLAPGVARSHRIEFDGRMMFATRVAREWIPNAVIFVGSASRKAAEMTAEKMAEDREVADKAILIDRVRRTFPHHVSTDVEISGKSTKHRRFAAMVDRGDKKALFDLVTPSHISLNGAIVKFQDVSQLDAGYTTAAVLSNRAKTDPADIIMLSQWTKRVITLDADASEFLAAA